jgi:hypothetical protein
MGAILSQKTQDGVDLGHFSLAVRLVVFNVTVTMTGGQQLIEETLDG